MNGTPCVLFHAVCPPRSGNLYSVTPARLEEHLRSIAARGCRTLTVEESISGNDDRTDQVVITFDDGSRTNFDHAAPLLERYGMTATFFVIAGRIGAGGKMDRPQIADLARRGFSIQSHGLTHIDLSCVDDRTMRDELRESRAILEEITGKPVTHFSAPFGMVDRRLVRAAQDAGYRALWTSDFGVNDGAADRYQLKRILVTKNMTARQLAERMTPTPAALQRLQMQKRLRDVLVRVLGRRSYDRMMMVFFGAYREG